MGSGAGRLVDIMHLMSPSQQAFKNQQPTGVFSKVDFVSSSPDLRVRTLSFRVDGGRGWVAPGGGSCIAARHLSRL